MLIPSQQKSIIPIIHKSTPKFLGDKCINACILNLSRRQPPIVPSAHRNPPRLLHVPLQHNAGEGSQPRTIQIRTPVPLRRQFPQIHRVVVGLELVVLLDLLQVLIHADSDERVARVREEVDERFGNIGGVDELVDETAAADAELKGGRGVAVVAVERGAPLDVESYH
ncbi:monooxygenase FAD-binding protein [Striga asiatica]|uniref:Monooxygenase FAD-binding protein n=1 Tax=Striga asiatica TaxID=4170 RepID=A0A5A7PYP0_STRAF|nr:monooxygenase FAD-binding protein [Striga asiatica]